MPVRSIIAAAIQMDAIPAPTAERLERAKALVAQAAAGGAQLAVLPEVFNTGYAYSDENFARAETVEGLTVSWMKETAARHRVHLAGSLMLHDGGEVYNAQLLFAPDGRMWRYDKSQPFAWERGYYRGRRGVTVAETDLGAIGMLICIDVIYPRLWQQYAGRVDLMIVSSCPPDAGHPTYSFPDGQQVTLEGMGPAFAQMENAVRSSFDKMMTRQAAWLGVPVVHAAGCGDFRSAIPNSRGYFLGLALTAPKLLRHLPQAGRIKLACEIYPATCIRDAAGRSLAAPAASGDAVALAEVALADRRPVPAGPQPASPLPRGTLFFMKALAALAVPTYRRGIRQLKT